MLIWLPAALNPCLDLAPLDLLSHAQHHLQERLKQIHHCPQMLSVSYFRRRRFVRHLLQGDRRSLTNINKSMRPKFHGWLTPTNLRLDVDREHLAGTAFLARWKPRKAPTFFELFKIFARGLDLIVSDIQMPNGDGLSFAHYCQEHRFAPVLAAAQRHNECLAVETRCLRSSPHTASGSPMAVPSVPATSASWPR